ncbi:MAG: hypothetical protein PHE87_09405, partial [Victivallaceae bacterium]|nr:hypothetical protein [Victivallaceae bacterium]
MKNINENHFLRTFKSWVSRRIPWEILVALAVNIIVLGLLFVLKSNPPQAVNPPIEISVDISDFSPPKPKEMVIPPSANAEDSAAVNAIETLNEAKSPEAIAQTAMQDFAPSADIHSNIQEKSSFERKTELERIEQGIRA